MLLGFLHISLCVSLKVKAGPRHERKNYSTLPLIDSAGDYANSNTSALPCHWDSSYDRHEMSPLGQTKPERQSQWRRGWWHAAHSLCGKDRTQVMLRCCIRRSRPALEAFFCVWCCTCNKHTVLYSENRSNRRWDSHKETQGSDQQNNKRFRTLGYSMFFLFVFFFFFSQHSFYLIWPWQTAGRLKGTENSVMTEKSGHSMKSQNLVVTNINYCGHSG